MEIRARRPAGLVETVSHRSFPGLSGEVGMARERLGPYREVIAPSIPVKVMVRPAICRV